MLNVQCRFLKNCNVYERMWKNTVKPDMPQMTIYMAHVLYMLDN